MAPNPREGADGARAAWRAALTPALFLVGISLPLIFLARSDQYLYYLASLELIPTYASAWLLLTFVCVPPVVLAALGLQLCMRYGLQRSAALLNRLLEWIAAAAAIVALLLDLVIWVRTFRPTAFEASGETTLSLVALVLGGLLVLSPWGRRTLLRMRPLAVICTVLGALSLF